MKTLITSVILLVGFATADTTYIHVLKPGGVGEVKTWLWEPATILRSGDTLALRETATSPPYLAQLYPYSIPDSIKCLIVATGYDDTGSVVITPVYNIGAVGSKTIVGDTLTAPHFFRLPMLPNSTLAPMLTIGTGDSVNVTSVRCW